MKSGKEFFALFGNIGTYFLALADGETILRIISLLLSIITSILILWYRLKVWYNEAKKDGKIDEKEIKEAVEIVNDTKEEINDTSRKIKEDSRRD